MEGLNNGTFGHLLPDNEGWRANCVTRRHKSCLSKEEEKEHRLYSKIRARNFPSDFPFETRQRIPRDIAIKTCVRSLDRYKQRFISDD